MLYGRTGWGSDAGGGLRRGQTPTAEFAVREMVRTRTVMSSNCCGTITSFVVHPLMNKVHINYMT